MFSLSDDHSRVILQELSDVPFSDYVNASYIDVSILFIFYVSYNDVNMYGYITLSMPSETMYAYITFFLPTATV